MVRGISSFAEWFTGFEKNYVIIGGTACDILMNRVGADFRATKDIDMVLIAETLDADFGNRFWEYIVAGGYEHRRKSTGVPQYYRFTEPKSSEYPAMIELFSRRLDGIALPSGSELTPLPIDDDVSSLSAILLDDAYYDFLKSGIDTAEALPILDVAHLIPFKAKAWLDLTRRRDNGEKIDSQKIRKHKRDIINLTDLIPTTFRLELPESIAADLSAFFAKNLGDAERLLTTAIIYGLAEAIPLDELKSLAVRLAEAKRRVDEITAATEKPRTKSLEIEL